MKKSGKQKQRRKEMQAMEAKWNPVLKHGSYNTTALKDSLIRLMNKNKLDLTVARN